MSLLHAMNTAGTSFTLYSRLTGLRHVSLYKILIYWEIYPEWSVVFSCLPTILPHRSTLQGNFFTLTGTSLTSTFKLCPLFIFNNDLPISLGIVSLGRAPLQRLL